MKPFGPIPPGFATDGADLIIGGRPARDYVEEAGRTPLFLYSAERLDAQYNALRAAMPERLAIHYAMKANPFPPLLRHMNGLVDGFDIASGGELSRFILALKVALAEKGGAGTIIFDEIDRGVGGATADAVGRRLKALGDDGQVLVVTHSPQVAALGAHHWRVSKAVTKGVTLSTVAALNADQRIDEVARMISGDTITEEARAAAKALL